MAVKRTGSLSSEVSIIDRRIKSLESSASTGTSGAGAVVASADDEDPTATGNLIGNSAPFQYKRVYEAWIYGPKVTGNTSRAELYFEDDPEINPGDYVRVQGVHGNTADEIDISASTSYKVFATDTPPWDDEDIREEGVAGQLRRSWRDTPPGNINHTVFYNPVVVPPADSPTNSGLQLIATRLMDSVTASNTTVTVNFNSNHRFKVGDVLYWDLPESLLDGYADKLFKVSAVVDSNTVQYQLRTALASPVSLNSGDLTDAYVYPVAQRYVEEGTTWIDTSVEPNKVYIWKEYRWYDTADPIGDVSAVKDGIAPSPVTGLSATSTTIPGANGQGGTAEITVSWTAPTTRSNGDPIANYLGHYEIQYKRSTEANWSGRIEVAGSATSAIIKDPFIRLQTIYDIRVYVYDIMDQASTPTSTTVTTTNFSETLNAPSTPVLTTRLGTITVTWDGLDALGNTPVQGVQFVEVHYSTTTGFTPSASTLYTTFPITLEGNYAVVSDLSYNTTYYFKLIFVRSDGYTNEKSAASTQASTQVSPLVDTDIVYSTLNNWPFNGGVVPANALASGAINASNMFGANVVVQSAIAANAIGADQIAAGAIIAGKIGVDAVTANTIAANAVTAGKIAANSIEADKIAAGAITASIIDSKQIDLKASSGATQRITLTSAGITAYNSSNDITFNLNGTSGTINAAAITVNNISASNITTGTLNADLISAGTIDASKISADTTYTGLLRTGAAGTNRIEIRGSSIANPGIVHLDGSGGSNFRFYSNGFSYLNNLELASASLTGTLSVSGTISGGTIQTAGSGKRVVISGGANEVQFYGTSGTEVGSISGASTTIAYDAGTGHSLQVGGTTVFSVNSSGASLAPGATFNSNLDVIGRVYASGTVQSGNGAVILGTTGNIIADGAISCGSSITSGTTVIVGVMNTTSLAANVRHASNGSALTRFTSDSRIKANITTITTGLDIVNQLNPVTFNSLVDDTDRLIPGFIAQDLEEVFDESIQIVTKIDSNSLDTSELPEGIDIQTDPLRSIETVHLLPYLVKAIQELSQQNTELQARIAALEGTT